MNAQQETTIAALRSLRVDSIEFYDIAALYLCGRLRVIRNCGLFFLLLSIVSLALVVVHWGNWMLSIIGFYCFCAFALGWEPYLRGRSGIQMIELSRDVNLQFRMDALRAATKMPLFRNDPVGVFISQRLSVGE
jgi:hypothetical protein